jgi:hypothetical protein
MRLAFERHIPGVDQFQVDLMHQGSRLHDGLGAFPPHKTYGQPVKFVINARCKRIERGSVATHPGEQKLRRFRDLRVRTHGGKDNMKKIAATLRFWMLNFAGISEGSFSQKGDRFK